MRLDYSERNVTTAANQFVETDPPWHLDSSNQRTLPFGWLL